MLEYGNVERLYEPAGGTAWTRPGAVLGRRRSVFWRSIGRDLGVWHGELRAMAGLKYDDDPRRWLDDDGYSAPYLWG